MSGVPIEKSQNLKKKFYKCFISVSHEKKVSNWSVLFIYKSIGQSLC